MCASVPTHMETNALNALGAEKHSSLSLSLPYKMYSPVILRDRSTPLRLGAQCVGQSHFLFEAVQEVFGEAVPVTRQTLPVLQNGVHTEPH